MQTFQTAIFVSLVTLGLYCGPAAAGAELYRARLTETSITEKGEVSTCACKVQTQGYGITAITPMGLGLSFTELTTYSVGHPPATSTQARLHHRYVDLSYTYGDDWWVITTGAGYLVNGDLDLSSASATEQSHSARGESLFLGPGFSIGWFEAYWIYRRNWVSYALPAAERSLASQHFQLGLAAHFTID